MIHKVHRRQQETYRERLQIRVGQWLIETVQIIVATEKDSVSPGLLVFGGLKIKVPTPRTIKNNACRLSSSQPLPISFPVLLSLSSCTLTQSKGYFIASRHPTHQEPPALHPPIELFMRPFPLLIVGIQWTRRTATKRTRHSFWVYEPFDNGVWINVRRGS